MKGVPLPEALAGRCFTVGEAREAGVRGADLRALGMHAPTRGVRAPAAPADLLARVEAFATGLPDDAAFSHVTAARLLGLPLPAALEADRDLDVMRGSQHTRIRRRGCRGHRGLERRVVELRHGIRVVGAADTWCDLAELSDPELTVHDLVVVGDAVASGPGALRAALDSRVRPRSKRRLETSLALVRRGSRSPMETRTRLMFHGAGFPEPELNAVVRDEHGGWVLCGDLVWRDRRVIGEYQGGDHASITRRSADASRAGAARDLGWTVIEVFSADVFSGARRRACLARFARALGLDPGTLDIT
jgi:hypothetical protein